MTNAPNPIRDKSYLFAKEIVLFSKILTKKKEFVIATQILKSGTSIGANVREGVYAQSKPDFISKMSIALKEAHETIFWLELIRDTQLLETNDFGSLPVQANELASLLTAIIKSARRNTR